MAQAIDALAELVGAEAARRIVEFRRDMHQHPEIGMDTARAADKIELFSRRFRSNRFIDSPATACAPSFAGKKTVR